MSNLCLFEFNKYKLLTYLWYTELNYEKFTSNGFTFMEFAT